MRPNTPANPRRDLALLLAVAGREQDVADLRAGGRPSSSPRPPPARSARARPPASPARHARRPSRWRRRSRRRVEGVKRSSGRLCSTSEDGKSCFEKPLLKRPTKIASISAGAMPASSIAARATRPISASASGSSSLPNGRVRPADDAGLGHCAHSLEYALHVGQASAGCQTCARVPAPSRPVIDRAQVIRRSGRR